MRRKLIIIFLTIFSAPNILSQGTSGNLEGWIIKVDGELLESVNILISSPSLLGTRGATTNPDGYFIITSIPPGNYIVTISSLAYRKTRLEDVVIILDKTTSLGRIRLEPEAVGLEEVVIKAERSEIDINSTSYGQNFTNDDLILLPVERNYQQIAGLTPEAKESYLGDGISIAGASGKENKYFIDGVGVSDPHANWFATKLPYNFVKEIQINTGAYEAEYESSLGGLVNVITNSGSNTFYGKAFAFFTNDKFTSNTVSVGEPSKGTFLQSDAGFGIGGPIVYDRLWFYASYNVQIEREELLVSNLGYQNYSMTANLFAGKLTWLINDDNKLEAVSFGDPTYGNIFPGYVPVTATFIDFQLKPQIYTGGIHASVRGNHTISKDKFLNSFISYSQFELERNDKGASNTPLYIDQINNIVSGDGVYRQNKNNEIKSGLTVTFLLDNQIVKAGLEYLNSSSEDNSDQLVIVRDGDSSFVKITYVSGGTVTYRVPTLFLQDSWFINPYFRFNFGVRWNYIFMIGSDGKVAQTIPDQIAPRFGIIFLPEGNDSQKFSLSLGRFYHTFPSQLLTDHYSNNVYNSGIAYREDPRNENAEGDTIFVFGGIYPKIENLKGPHYDEITIGYERKLPLNLFGGVKFIYRTMIETIKDGADPETGEPVIGNPGKGDMTAWPEIERDYTALEIILGSNSIRNFYFQLSYILSRLYGNFTGFYDTDGQFYGPLNPQYATPEQLVNSTGLLPHDRTHIFKFFGSYYFDFGLSVGTSFFISSGKPLSERGANSLGYPLYRFLQQRGTAGRTPTVWDLNLRLSYEVNRLLGLNNKMRLLADLLHIGSKKAAVEYDEMKYFKLDDEGNQVNPNPNYGQPIRFQPPMSLRLGLEVEF